MIKQSVKKPFTVLVAVVMVIALGVVSLINMTADLLPNISLPYLIVITTYPGASPEKVENDVTVPIEEALGTVSGVKTVTSTSNENFSTVQLEFEDDTDMDSALVKVFSALDPVEANLPDMVGTPEIMEVSMDMVATAYVGFQYDGKDIFELTSFVKDEVVPYIERVDGVASITEIGMVQETIHVELNEDKVDELNNKILAKANDAFAEAYDQFNDAKKEINDGQKALDDAQAQLDEQWAELNKGYEEINKNQQALDEKKAEFDEQYEAAIKAYGDMAKSQFTSAKAQLDAAQAQIDEYRAPLDEAKAQLDAAQQQLDDNQKQINQGLDSYNDNLDSFNKKKEEALKSANADQLLKLSTLAQLIYAQNFAMPAGYIDDEKDDSWLLKVGENYDDVESLGEIVLCNIDGIGDISIADVADITLIDNANDTYAKINGQQGTLLAVYKSSTASTKQVGDAVVAAAEELASENPGLHSINFFNQGDYIKLLTSSILESMVIGAVLAIIILAWFLKDVRPTIVVAISMPLSILLAIVGLYFSGITLNIMSLAGLALGVGMLVDNSIVVIENIYRLKTLGMPAAQAAVTGARQVAAPIISSTLTTICVFLPMIFTTGLVKELLIPMAASVVYCLVASLLIALSVVPAAGSTLLKNSHEKEHKLFDRVMDKYGRSLAWCLSHKAIPLIVTIALLGASVYEIIRMGVVMIPDMYSEPLAVTIIVDEEKTREQAYEIADEAVLAISKVEGVETASAMASESMLSMFTSSAAGGTEAYNSYLCYVLIEGDNPSEKMVKRMVDDMGKALDKIDCEYSISANEMDMSMLTGSGLSVYIYGNDLEKCTEISEDVMDIVAKVPGYIEISNGMEDGDNVVHLMIDKNKAMSLGLSVAQVYAELAAKITDTVTATTITVDGVDMELEIQDSTHPLTKENLLDYEFKVAGVDEDGSSVTNIYKLGEFSSIEEEKTLGTIDRKGNSRYMTVSASVEEGKNATLLSRELKPLIEEYDAPAGYRVEISGESETVNNMLVQMSKLIALGFLFIYLVMVAQFQSLLSPFIVLFTIPLAFTGGMAGLLIMGEQLSIMSLMGFTILMGTVVNNGIVFVDYVNQLRIEGKERREALIETGKTRMRPILMTALTTILAMSKLLFGSDIGSQMGGGMAVVIMGGLIYATFMTLYIVPVIYDIFFKRQPLNINVE